MEELGRQLKEAFPNSAYSRLPDAMVGQLYSRKFVKTGTGSGNPGKYLEDDVVDNETVNSSNVDISGLSELTEEEAPFENDPVLGPAFQSSGVTSDPLKDNWLGQQALIDNLKNTKSMDISSFVTPQNNGLTVPGSQMQIPQLGGNKLNISL